MSELQTQDALLEIGTEEIPASYLPPALSYMKSFSETFLKQKRLSCQSITVFGTPRRLALLIFGMPLKSEGLSEEIFGPSLAASKDSQNQWTPAAKGFASSRNVPLESLQVRPTQKGDYLCIIKKHEGEKVEKIVRELFIELIPSIPFPKRMIWNKTRFKFARPIRNLVALYGEKILSLHVADVKSSRKTFGLFHLSSSKSAIPSPQKYLMALKNHCVLVDPEARKKTVLHYATLCAHRVKGQLKIDERLLDEIVWLVEHPVAVLGNFDPGFLSLPQEILMTCMTKQQKFLPLFNAQGKLIPHFVAIRNGISNEQETVRKGYEKVLNARLDDARFFLTEDLKKPLDHYVKKSAGILLHEKLGSVGEKIDRMKKTAQFLIGAVSDSFAVSSDQQADLSIVERAIHLCKFDLVTTMVHEFPELQGTVGEIYSVHYGENPKVAQAIKEHYYPTSNQGALPQSPESSVVALTDKLDNLVGNFLLGFTPSGNVDPYGFRRQSTGILRIVLEHRWDMSLREIFRVVLKQFSFVSQGNASPAVDQSKIEENIFNFIMERFQLFVQDSGYALDEIYSVAKNSVDTDVQDLRVARLKDKISAVHAIRAHPDFDAITTAFKRTCNILKQAKQKSIIFAPDLLNPSLLQHPLEKELHSLMVRVSEETQILLAKKEYEQVLQKWVSLRKTLDQFFENVMVMDSNPEICKNRLSLLSILENLFKKVADFSLIQKNA